MSIRDFLRGGYRTLTEGTVVMRHGVPIFSVMPRFPKTTVKPIKMVEDAVETSENARKRRKRTDGG